MKTSGLAKDWMQSRGSQKWSVGWSRVDVDEMVEFWASAESVQKVSVVECRGGMR